MGAVPAPIPRLQYSPGTKYFGKKTQRKKFNMEKTIAPFVYWAQSNTEISLRVDLRDVSEPEVQVEEEEIEFIAIGKGSHGEQRYSFTLEFYLPVCKDFTYELTSMSKRNCLGYVSILTGSSM